MQKPTQTNRDVETQPVLFGCKIKMLVGYEDEKMFATITTTKEDVDYQFWYPGGKMELKNTNTSRIIIPGMMKMKVNWYIANQLQANLHQNSTILKLL